MSRRIENLDQLAGLGLMVTDRSDINLNALFDASLPRFVKGAAAKVENWYATQFPNNVRPKVVVDVGPRYLKLVKAEGAQGASVYCFVDRTNGNILKGSWKAPVKNGVRGSIFDNDNGLSKVNWHGTIYLR